MSDIKKLRMTRASRDASSGGAHLKGGDSMSKSPPNRIKIKAQCPDEDRLEEFIALIRNMYGRNVRSIHQQNKSKRGEYRVMMHVYLEVP